MTTESQLITTAREFSMLLERLFAGYDNVTADMLDLRCQFEVLARNPKLGQNVRDEQGRPQNLTPEGLLQTMAQMQLQRDGVLDSLLALTQTQSLVEARRVSADVGTALTWVLRLQGIEQQLEFGFRPTKEEARENQLKADVGGKANLGDLPEEVESKLDEALDLLEGEMAPFTTFALVPKIVPSSGLLLK